MATLLGPLLAAMILTQTSGRPPIAGEVVDDQGKAVADIPVVFYVPPSVSGKEYQAEAEVRTDAAGQFRMNLPPLGRVFIGGINFLAYRPGSAITAKSFYPPPYRLVMLQPLCSRPHNGCYVVKNIMWPLVLEIRKPHLSAEPNAT